MSEVTADITGWHGTHYYRRGYSLCGRSTVLGPSKRGGTVTPFNACRECRAEAAGDQHHQGGDE